MTPAEAHNVAHGIPPAPLRLRKISAQLGTACTNFLSSTVHMRARASVSRLLVAQSVCLHRANLHSFSDVASSGIAARVSAPFNSARAATHSRSLSHVMTFAVAAAISIAFSSVALSEGRFMRSVYEASVASATETERRIRQGTDKNVGPSKFGIVAKALWPFKTAAHIATIAGRDERTAARWLSGEFEPPGVLLVAVLAEITKPKSG